MPIKSHFEGPGDEQKQSKKDNGLLLGTQKFFECSKNKINKNVYSTNKEEEEGDKEIKRQSESVFRIRPETALRISLQRAKTTELVL